jgi:hypothetical protein
VKPLLSDEHLRCMARSLKPGSRTRAFGPRRPSDNMGGILATERNFQGTVLRGALKAAAGHAVAVAPSVRWSSFLTESGWPQLRDRRSAGRPNPPPSARDKSADIRGRVRRSRRARGLSAAQTTVCAHSVGQLVNIAAQCFLCVLFRRQNPTHVVTRPIYVIVNGRARTTINKGYLQERCDDRRAGSGRAIICGVSAFVHASVAAARGCLTPSVCISDIAPPVSAATGINGELKGVWKMRLARLAILLTLVSFGAAMLSACVVHEHRDGVVTVRPL